MIDIVTREGFEKWLARTHEDRMDQLPMQPRSIRDWVADLNRVTKQTAESLGRDRGFGGIFSDGGESAMLHDPEGDDPEDEGF